MKKLLPLLLCFACMASSLPVSRQAAFFFAPTPAVASGGGGGGGSGYVLVFHSNAHDNINGATNTVNATGATLITAVLSAYSALPSVVDSQGNTYRLAASTNGGGGYQLALYYCTNPVVTSSLKIWAAQAGTYDILNVAGWSGGTGQLDLTSVAFAPGNSLQPGAFTPSQNNELIIGGATISVNETLTVATPPVILNQSATGGPGAMQGALATNIQTTATSSNPLWSVATGGDLLVGQMCFKP